jgi:multicomponent Na+:H+ antiporter subunit D
MTVYVVLPVLLPLAGAAATLLLGNSTVGQRALSIAVHAAVLGCAVAVLVVADTRGPQVVPLAGWAPPVGIALVADRLAALLLVVSMTVLLAVLLYAIAQSRTDPAGGFPASVFHPAYLVLTAGVCLAFLSGDLFTLFVAFEVVLTASYVLVTIGGTPERLRAGTTYVVVSLTGSILFLTTLAMIYAATGTVNLADLALRLGELEPGLRTTFALLLLLVFAIKAAVVPLHAWLPDSYPAAPTPITAVFAGLLTKIGVYAMIRTQTLLFPDGAAAGVLLVLAAGTMLVGLLGAIAQSDLNRMLSFVLVGHIGYILFGLGLFTAAGVAGSIFYTVHHIVTVSALFLAGGLVERRAGTVDIERLGGLAEAIPLVGLLFAVPAASLSGLPPLSGFLAKLALLQAAVTHGGAAALSVAAITLLASVLTLVAMAKVWTKAFWGRPVAPEPDRYPHDAVLVGTRKRAPRSMTAPAGALVAVGLGIVLLAGPLQALTQRAAADLMQPGYYVQVVLDGS